jgi:homoserine dehydrogenase
MSADDFNIGLLGRGTVGSAFSELLAERGEQVRRLTGRRPRLSGVLTREQGRFEDVLENAELVIELMGGVDTPREHVL